MTQQQKENLLIRLRKQMEMVPAERPLILAYIKEHNLENQNGRKDPRQN